MNTPGPWRFVRTDTTLVNPNWNCGQILHGERLVANVECVRGYRNDVSEANAALIAAAPELLEACKAILLAGHGHFDTCFGLNFAAWSSERENQCTCGAAVARKAIAKAEGGTR